MQYNGIVSRELCQEEIEVGTLVVKEIKDLTRSVAEVDQDIAFVFLLSKGLGNIALTDAASAVDQQGGLPAALYFPSKQLIIYLSFVFITKY